MTREEIIQGLYRGDSRAIKEAIKALEEPNVNETLEKIRAEVMQLRKHNDYLDEQGVTIMEVLQIIDKYKAEMESEEDEL